MSKGILEFDLSEERAAFDSAINGALYLNALLTFDGWLRGIVDTGQRHDGSERIQARLHEIMDERGISHG